ncbi:MAG: hypothetical protein IPI31_05060 [Bacteroidetes bacterium]|jgi:hypothetical protein|nr:hypothetical protein [Bacteroidota bacterium]
MKYLQFSALFLLLTTVTSVFAQKTVEVKEVVSPLSMGERSGYSVSLGDRSEKDVVKALKIWINDIQKKVEVDETGKHEFKATNITAPTLSENPSNIYFLFTTEKDELIVTGFFEVNGAFVSSTTNPDKVKACETLMQKFVYRLEKIAIQETVTAEQKILEQRNDEQTSLEKKNKQLNDQITEWEESIKKAKSELETNAKNQEAKKEEIASQQKKLNEIQSELKKYESY